MKENSIKKAIIQEKHIVDQELLNLTNQLYAVDNKLKDLKRSLQKIDGTNDATYVNLQKLEVDQNDIDNLKNLKEIVNLTTQAKNIIEKMIRVDPSVHLDCFMEYGY